MRPCGDFGEIHVAHLRLLDCSSSSIIRTNRTLFPQNDYILYIPNSSLISAQPGRLLTRTASLMSSITASSSFFGRNSHRPPLPAFCISRQASFIRSSPLFLPNAWTLELIHSCRRDASGTRLTPSESSSVVKPPAGVSLEGLSSILAGKEVFRSSDVSCRS
jgi:hypothetical protein